MKFSIIIPVYNVEKYLRDCLDSIINQTYSDYEVIMIDDGSEDSSYEIMKEYAKKYKNFKTITQKNQGVSEARNNGMKAAKGEYLIFVDSDDTINEKLLEEINKEISKYPNLDLIKFQLETIDSNNKKVDENEIFHNIDGENAFKKLINSSLFVTAYTYAYRKKYLLDNEFKFEKGRIHEDFGSTPFVVVNSKKVSSIKYTGYNYMIRENSIITSVGEDKLRKKTEDILFHYDNLMKKIDSADNVSDDTKKIFKSYISNTLISHSSQLKGNLLKEYILEIKKRNIDSYLIDDTLFRKIKKRFFQYCPGIYIRLFVK